MRGNEYKSLASRVGSFHDEYEGTLAAGKSNGATYLDIGGKVDAVVQERGDEVKIQFIAEDSTRGELTLPKEAFE